VRLLEALCVCDESSARAEMMDHLMTSNVHKCLLMSTASAVTMIRFPMDTRVSVTLTVDTTAILLAARTRNIPVVELLDDVGILTNRIGAHSTGPMRLREQPRRGCGTRWAGASACPGLKC
jgi:hypothetical protein